MKKILRHEHYVLKKTELDNFINKVVGKLQDGQVIGTRPAVVDVVKTVVIECLDDDVSSKEYFVLHLDEESARKAARSYVMEKFNEEIAESFKPDGM